MCGWQNHGWTGNVNNKPDPMGILLDVFLYEEKDNLLKNLFSCSSVIKKKITYKLMEQNQITINDVTVKTVKNISEFVKAQYIGDICNSVVIHIQHGTKNPIFIHTHYSDVYKAFDRYIETAKQNTLTKINLNNNIEKKHNTNHLTIKENIFGNAFDILKHINENKIEKVSFTDINILDFAYDIKYYFPDIKLYCYMKEISDHEYVKYLHMLNYIDHLYCIDKGIYDKFNDNDIYYIHKPLIYIYDEINLFKK